MIRCKEPSGKTPYLIHRTATGGQAEYYARLKRIEGPGVSNDERSVDLGRSSLRSEGPRAPGGENAHDAKHDIEQGQRVSDQTPHSAHTRHGAEHA